jgi:hypothetical protein
MRQAFHISLCSKKEREKNGKDPHLTSPLIKLNLNLSGGTLGTAATAGPLYQPQMIGDGDCGEIGGIKIGRGNRRLKLAILINRNFLLICCI